VSLHAESVHCFLNATDISGAGIAHSAGERFFQWLLGALFPWARWPECEADYLSPSSAKVKNAWNYSSTPTCVFIV